MYKQNDVLMSLKFLNKQNYILGFFFNVLFLGILLNPSLRGNGDIEETSTLTPIVKYLAPLDARKNPADSKKVVTIDVDHVLLTPSDQCLHPKYRAHADSLLRESLPDPSLYNDYWSHVLETHPRKLVDPNISTLLASLKEREIKTIAFTNAPTGPYGHYPKLEDWRMEELKTFQFNFSYSFPQYPYIKFNSVRTKTGDRFPLFIRGVLFSDLLPKGEPIGPFHQAVNYQFDEVISLDDKRTELESQQAACQQLGIKFKGFYYTAVLNTPISALNEARTQFQIRTLVNQKRWLCDAEADEEMKISKILKE